MKNIFFKIPSQKSIPPKTSKSLGSWFLVLGSIIKKPKAKSQSLIALLLLTLFPLLSFAQGFQTEFGKNRVQYHTNEWSFYESDNFIVYFYQGGQDLAKYVTTISELNVADIESKLEHKLSSKVEIMVYHNNADLKQTNIGLGLETNNTGGITQIIGNKVFVYFNGDHENLKKQVIEGVAKVYLDNLVFGSNIQEIVQNAVLLNLPDWFVNGLISYVGEEWNEELDGKLKQYINQKKFKKFNQLEGAEATFLGHSLWHYIADVYGESSIPNILYLTRVNRSVDNGFTFVLGNDVKTIIAEWQEYVQQVYQYDTTERDSFQDENLVFKTKKRRKKVDYDNIKLSPDGNKMVYATNEMGLIKVYIHNFETGNSERILKTGFKAYNLPTEHNYPILAWNRTGKQLVMIYERRDKIMLYQYQVEEKTGEKYEITKFQQVVDACFTPDSRQLILSAMRRGQIDLFTYFIPNTKVGQLTNDFYDDLEPQYITMGEREGVLFKSNRISDTLSLAKYDSLLPTKNYDLFFFNIKNSREDQVLTRITETPLNDEKMVMPYNDSLITYLSDKNGITNRFVAKFDTTLARTDQVVHYVGDSIAINPPYNVDSMQQLGMVEKIEMRDVFKPTAISFPVTNNNHNILEHDIAIQSKQQIDVIKENGIYKVYKQNVPQFSESLVKKLKDTPYKKQMKNVAAYTKEKTITNTKTTQPEKDIFEGLLEEIATPIPPKKEKEEKPTPPADGEIDIDNYVFGEAEEIDSTDIKEPYYFQSIYDIQKAIEQNNNSVTDGTENVGNGGLSLKKSEDVGIAAYRRSRVRTYTKKFAVDYVVTQLDNSIIFNQYQNFGTAVLPGEFNQGIKGLIKFGASDLFEDYKIVGGFRLPLGLSGSEYFIEYQDLKKRIDKKLLFYRQTQKNLYSLIPDDPNGDFEIKNITNYLQATFTYPFDITKSIRLHTGYRNDKVNTLARNINTLEFLPYSENWLFGKLEYVFDNTLSTSLNILNGTRFKLYFEAHHSMNATINDNQFTLNFRDTGFLGIIGGDFRHYLKVHRNIIWANRFTFASSFGSQKMVYYLGAVDNWMNYSFNYSTPISQTANYGFQSLAPNLRGFDFNVRNGSNFGLVNSELRIPIFAYLSSTPLKSEFLRNFQIVGFGDMGTAWEEGLPWEEQNRYYTYTYPEDPSQTGIVAEVQYFKNPIVYGYGFGLRSKLLGYFVKVDWGWGIDSGNATPRRTYLSLGTDF